jgi:hypothetical protein
MAIMGPFAGDESRLDSNQRSNPCAVLPAPAGAGHLSAAHTSNPSMIGHGTPSLHKSSPTLPLSRSDITPQPSSQNKRRHAAVEVGSRSRVFKALSISGRQLEEIDPST